VYGVEYEIKPTFLDDFYAHLPVRLDQRQHHNANRSHKGGNGNQALSLSFAGLRLSDT
jgi:hypothetical protein